MAVLSPAAYPLVPTALVFAPVSRVAPAREIGILIGTFLGGGLLAEDGLGRRLLASFFMVLGIVALAVGQAVDRPGRRRLVRLEASVYPAREEREAVIGTVVSVSRSAGHTFGKPAEAGIRLLAGLGVEGDAHLGESVKHRSRVRRDPTQPNLRQVHLIHAELHEELRASGFDVAAGQMGENVTTLGIDLLALPAGTTLHLGETASVRVTGLRNPCKQLDDFRPGLMQAVLDRDEHGNLVRKAGIMGVVLTGGEVRTGDEVRVVLPPGPPRPLGTV